MGRSSSFFRPMPTTINQAEILIALVVAAHAGVLAVRLCFSLYKA
jgi:photosystem I subunit 12